MKSKYIILGLAAWCITIGTVKSQDIYEPDKYAKTVETKGLKVKLKDGAQPDVYIDGKKYDYEILELLDHTKIKAINVLKDEKALEEYNAPNGVLLVTTVNSDEEVKPKDAEFRIRKTGDPDPNATTSIKFRGTGGEPMVIIDGKVATKDELSKLSPDNIEKINVLKGEKAMEEYKSETGVIIVTTKK